MKDSTDPKEGIVHFLRKRDYRLVKELGQGSCGKTVLLYDDQIEEHFVCKKYVPYSEAERQQLFTNFVREIKLLHKIHHQNIVRVFNHYIYAEQFTGFILMEYVDGSEVDESHSTKQGWRTTCAACAPILLNPSTTSPGAASSDTHFPRLFRTIRLGNNDCVNSHKNSLVPQHVCCKNETVRAVSLTVVQDCH
jgi:serine/threonine protein kinase